MARVFRRNDLENAINTAQTVPLKKGLAGELAVLDLLESGLPESCIIIWDPEFLHYKPDILVIDPNLGFLFLEVKNWSLQYIKQFLFNGKSETGHGLKYPLGQTDNYINELQSYVNSMKEKQVDIYRSTSSLVIYTGFTKDEFLNRSEVRNWKQQDIQNYFKKHIFLEDLKTSPYLKLMSSKKFKTNLHTVLSHEELNYLAKSVGHTDNDLKKESKNNHVAPIPAVATALPKAKAANIKMNKPLKRPKTPLFFLYFFIGIVLILGITIFYVKPFSTKSEVSSNEYSEEIYEKAIEEAKFATAIGEYQQALGLYELALTGRPDDNETKSLYWSLMLLNDLANSAENDDLEKVITAIDDLSNEGEVPLHLERQFDQLYKETVDKQTKQNTIAEVIQQVGSLIAEKEFERAQSLMDDLSANQSLAQILENNEAKIVTLSKEMAKGIEEQNEQEKAAEIKVEEESRKVEIISNQRKYFDKLNQIEIGLKELDYLYEDGITHKMLEAEIEHYERWDDALNEIYGVLKTTLTPGEMDSLRNEQRDWILYRDYETEVAAKEFEGGTFEEVTLISVKQQLTRDRCYTLVENYME
jgi:uncharacterized protein YecT (DUF1311 family)